MNTNSAKLVGLTLAISTVSLAFAQVRPRTQENAYGSPSAKAEAAVTNGQNGGNGNSGRNRLYPPVLVDKEGKLIGRYVNGAVLLRYKSDMLAMAVTRELVFNEAARSYTVTGYETWALIDMYFTSADCSGTPYVSPDNAVFGTRYVGIGRPAADQTWQAYIFDHETRQPLGVSSKLSFDPTNAAAPPPCTQVSQSGLFLPLVDSIAIAAPPLRLE